MGIDPGLVNLVFCYHSCPYPQFCMSFFFPLFFLCKAVVVF